MPPLNLSRARVIDPILTTGARGYTNAEYIGRVLFPVVSVPKRGFKRIEFGKEAFVKYATRRAPGTATKRISFGYEGKPASLDQHALDATVPTEYIDEAAEVPGVDLQQEGVDITMKGIRLSEECEQAALATDPANYAATNKETVGAGHHWDDPASDPKDQIKAAKEGIRRKIGREPNTLVITKPQFNALDDHPKIVDKMKHTTSDSLTVDMLKRYFSIDNIAIGEGVYVEDEDDEDFKDIWPNAAVLAYVPGASERSVRVPSYAYTYQLLNHPFVEPYVYERQTKSWVAGVTDERSPELVGADAGFLLSDVVTPA